MKLESLLPILYGRQTPEPHVEQLGDQIILEIKRRSLRRRKLSALAWGLCLVLSATGLAVSFAIGVRAFADSGTSEMLSLAVSDFSVVFGHFSDFLLSLLESLPALPLVGSLLAAAVMLLSVRGLGNNYFDSINQKIYGSR